MNEIKVSIIVPIYNSEKYLEKCLESLVNQTLSNIEIILVDDCSTDNSKQICNRYLERYENIVLIKNSVNKGPSESRNLAINISRGKYIGFVDSDDWVDIDMYKTLYNYAISKSCDMVICKMIEVYPNNIEKKIDTKGIEILEDKKDIISKFMKFEILAYSCNKLFKSELFRQNNIVFPNLRFGEDQYTTFITLYKSNKVGFLDEYLYFYNKRENSSTTDKFSLVKLDILKSINMIREFMVEEEIYLSFKYLYQFRYMFVLFGNIIDACIKELTFKEAQNVYIKIIDDFSYNMNDYNLNYQISNKNKIRILIFKKSFYVYYLIYRTIFKNKI